VKNEELAYIEGYYNPRGQTRRQLYGSTKESIVIFVPRGQSRACKLKNTENKKVKVTSLAQKDQTPFTKAQVIWLYTNLRICQEQD
jgi:hypothetical protein